MKTPFSQLANQPKLKVALSNVASGNLSFIYGENNEVLENRKVFLTRNGLDIKNTVVMGCDHKSDIYLVTAEDKGKGAMVGTESIRADAFLTQEINTPLFLLIADCLPTVVFDPANHALAVIHLSWRTTNDQLAIKVIKAMQQHFGSQAKDLLVSIGPGIHPESYAYLDPEQADNPGWKPYLHKLHNGLTSINLYSYNTDQFRHVGIPAEQIETSDIDTASSEEYFSHFRSERTGEKEGRFAVVASLL